MEACMQVLQAVLAEASVTYLIIDALGECSEREGQHGLFALFSCIHSWNLDQLHILATSRQQADIDEALQPYRTDELAIVQALVNHDIKLYIKSRLDQGRLKKWSRHPEVVEDIKTTVESGAGGMYGNQIRNHLRTS